MGWKESYQNSVRSRLQDLDSRVEEVLDRADKATAEAKADSKVQLQELRSRQDQVKARLKELEETGESAWQDLKSGVEAAVVDLQAALNAAWSRFE
jgi:hypothetical protein